MITTTNECQSAEFLGRSQKGSKCCVYSTANCQGTWMKSWERRWRITHHLTDKFTHFGIKKSPLTWDILSRCLASSLSLAFWKWACSFSSPGVSKYLSTASGVLAAVVGTDVKFGDGEREGREKKRISTLVWGKFNKED